MVPEALTVPKDPVALMVPGDLMVLEVEEVVEGDAVEALEAIEEAVVVEEEGLVAEVVGEDVVVVA